MQIAATHFALGGRPAGAPDLKAESAPMMERLDEFYRTGTFGDGSERSDQATVGEEQMVFMANILVRGACRFDEDSSEDAAMGQPGVVENHDLLIQFEGPKEAPSSVRGVFKGKDEMICVASRWEPQGGLSTQSVARYVDGEEAILVGFAKDPATGKNYFERLKLSV